MADFQTVAPPSAGLYRLGRRTSEPFTPPDWIYTAPNGTFDGRFDDPRLDLSEDLRFRIVYCASSRVGAFGETLANQRPPVRLLSKLNAITDDEPAEESFFNGADPDDPSRGLVGAAWRLKRAMAFSILEPSLRFVDVDSARTLQQLRLSVPDWASALDFDDVDQSLVMGPSREITQRIALHVYEQTDERGDPRFAGIRYVSRHDQLWECWAVFADRIRHLPGMPGPPETIFPDDPDLLEVASIFRLTIETIDGSGHYYRP